MTDQASRRVELLRPLVARLSTYGWGGVESSMFRITGEQAKAIIDLVESLPDLMGEGVVSSVDESAATRGPTARAAPERSAWLEGLTAEWCESQGLAWFQSALLRHEGPNGQAARISRAMRFIAEHLSSEAPPLGSEPPCDEGNPSTDVTISLNPTDVERAR